MTPLRLFLLFLLLSSAAFGQPSEADVRAFVGNWAKLFEQPEKFQPDPADLNCDTLAKMYAPEFTFYGTSFPNDSLCAVVRGEFDLLEMLSTFRFEVEALRGRSESLLFRITFVSQSSMGALIDHYMMLAYAENTFHIISHSSVADDAWRVRKAEIAASRITGKDNQSYYILSADSTIFENRIVYFLTDTLDFYEPFGFDACSGIEFLGYSTNGRVSVASASKKSPRVLTGVHEITNELNAPTYLDHTIVRGGFACLVPADSTSPDGKSCTRWVKPGLVRTLERGKTTYLLITQYERGSYCQKMIVGVRVKRNGRVKVWRGKVEEKRTDSH